jgi:hypothetical protein
MPLNEIPEFFSPETRSLINSALEQALQRLLADGLADAELARRKLARTIVALVSVGETDPAKLKWFAIHAAKGALQVEAAKARRAEKTAQATAAT